MICPLTMVGLNTPTKLNPLKFNTFSYIFNFLLTIFIRYAAFLAVVLIIFYILVVGGWGECGVLGVQWPWCLSPMRWLFRLKSSSCWISFSVVSGKICQQPAEDRGFPSGIARFPPTLIPAAFVYEIFLSRA